MANWSAYQFHPAFVLGFHGTAKSVARQLVNQSPQAHLQVSRQPYDWLGPGAYFWEQDPERGLEWARQHPRWGSRVQPAVVGAVIDLGLCLDLTTRTGLYEVQQAYLYYRDAMRVLGLPQATNRLGKDLLIRELDCHVITCLHHLRQRRGLAPYDSVRAAFPEDRPLYEGAGFRAKNHIQLCIVNPARCIKAYFKPFKH